MKRLVLVTLLLGLATACTAWAFSTPTWVTEGPTCKLSGWGPHTQAIYSLTARSNDGTMLTTEYDVYGTAQVIHVLPWRRFSLTQFLDTGDSGHVTSARFSVKLIATKRGVAGHAAIWGHLWSTNAPIPTDSTDFQLASYPLASIGNGLYQTQPSYRNASFQTVVFAPYQEVRDWQTFEVPVDSSDAIEFGAGWRNGWPDWGDSLAFGLYLDSYCVS